MPLKPEKNASNLLNRELNEIPYGLAAFFFYVSRHSHTLNCQERVRPHGERHVAVPSVPGADFVFIKTDFTFGTLKTLFDCPSASCRRCEIF